MADIIKFRSRAQIERDEKERIRAEWKEWLAFEDQCIKQQKFNEEHIDYKRRAEQKDSNDMTEAEIVEDYKQYLSPDEIQEIEAFDAWLEKHDNN